MGLGVQYFCLLSFLILIYTVGMLIFAKGFLLKRVVVERNSTCSVEFAHQSDLHGGTGCWMHGNFKRAIIIVIDALKYDFIKYHNEDVTNIPYKNKMPFIHQLLSTKPLNSKLYRFIADPPTTTLQRLKGITTGSLPTFVDAGANFASSEITEDNFIDQLVKQGKLVKFLGDDTWDGLFPGRFIKSFSFHSFNVKDLHTVDDGILKHLYLQLKKKDWDVTIAHFLGVDHCGHRYGPHHSAMTEKLAQMNEMIRNVTTLMTGDTVLFVLGDHGMTLTGDHGGESRDELEAGLFVYSPTQITSSLSKTGEEEEVQQTDLVPTISLLLGIPIPFSNLGHAITDLFTFCPSWKTGATPVKQIFHSVKALRLNAQQIHLYLKEYYAYSSDFPLNKFYELDHFLKQAENDLQALLTALVKEGETEKLSEGLHRLKEQYTAYIKSVRNICQSIWAKFDYMSITIGIMTLSIALLVNVYMIRISYWWKTEVPATSIVVILITLVYLAFAAFQSFLVGESLSAFMVYLLGACLIIGLTILILKFKVRYPLNNILNKDSVFTVKNFETFFSLMTLAIYFCVYFSNSFVVNEDSVVLFLGQSLLWMYCISLVLDSLRSIDLSAAEKNKRQKVQKVFDFMRFLTHPTVLVIIVTLFISIVLRFSKMFAACREEKVQCEISVFLSPLGNLVNELEQYKNPRYFFSVACLGLLILIPRQWMKHYGNLNGASISVLCVRYFCPAAGVCCALHWALQGLPQKLLDSMPVWQQVLFPRAVYILVIFTLLCITFNPLCIYLKPKSLPHLNGNQPSVSQLFTKLKEKLQKKLDEKPRVAYGLATSFTAAVVATVTAVVTVLSMLLGDGVCPSLLLAIFAVGGFLEIITLREKHSSPPSFMCYVGTFSFMSSYFFFTTGHQATVPAIRFESAFNGFHGDFNNKILPGLLIHLNTFAAEIFFGIVSPLIILWPLTEGTFVQWILRKTREEERRWKGDFILFEDGDTLRKLLFRLFSCILFFHGTKMFGVTLAAALHRRHLMVWKIFAPRFVFQAMSCFSVFGISLLMFLFIMRVDKCLDIWVNFMSTQ